MGPREWQILCREFDIVPELGNMDKSGKCFVKGNIALGHEGDKQECSFEEFNSIMRRLYPSHHNRFKFLQHPINYGLFFIG